MSQTIRRKRVKTALVVPSVFVGMADHGGGSGTLDSLKKDLLVRSRTYGDRLFRAMKYVRPGAVWAV